MTVDPDLESMQVFSKHYDLPNYVTAKSTGFGFTSLNTTRIVPVEGDACLELYNGVPEENYDEAFINPSYQLLKSAVAFFAEIIDAEIRAGRMDPELSDMGKTQKTDFFLPEVAEGRYAEIHHQPINLPLEMSSRGVVKRG